MIARPLVSDCDTLLRTGMDEYRSTFQDIKGDTQNYFCVLAARNSKPDPFVRQRPINPWMEFVHYLVATSTGLWSTTASLHLWSVAVLPGYRQETTRENRAVQLEEIAAHKKYNSSEDEKGADRRLFLFPAESLARTS